jgi:NAD(P)H-nitrite reductase large subunit
VVKPTADRIPDDAIVCRCERVTAGEIRKWIRRGIRDLNQIKAITRAGMGACGSKTCGDLILQLFKDEGVPAEDITLHTIRPLFIEAPLGVFSNISYGGSRE